MTYLENLSKGVNVEWKKIGDVIKLEKGKQLNKELLSQNGLYPAFNGGISYTGFTDKYNYDENKTIISQGGASAGFVNYISTKFYANAHCYVIMPKIEIVESRFIFHFLKLNQVRLMNKQHGAGIPALRTSEILEIPIPIPPIEIQQKIVELLDSFNNHTEELTAELTLEYKASKQQFEYYRKMLLSFDENNTVREKLDQIVKLQRGRRLIKSQLQLKGKYPVYQNAMNPLGYYNQSNVKANTTFIICAGAAGEIGFSDVDYWAADDVYFFNTPKELNNKYLYYYLLTQQHKISSQVRRASIPRLSKEVLEKIQIPIPSLEKQERIVSILDKYNNLTFSIRENLSKEIELRKIQYEYFREMLFSFPKTENA